MDEKPTDPLPSSPAPPSTRRGSHEAGPSQAHLRLVVGGPPCQEPISATGADAAVLGGPVQDGAASGVNAPDVHGQGERVRLDRAAILAILPEADPAGPTTAAHLIASFADGAERPSRPGASRAGMMKSLGLDTWASDAARAAQRRALRAFDIAVPLASVVADASAALHGLQDVQARISPFVADYASEVAETLRLADRSAATVALSAGYDLATTVGDLASQHETPARAAAVAAEQIGDWTTLGPGTSAAASILQDMPSLATDAESALATLHGHTDLPDALNLAVDGLGATALYGAAGEIARYGAIETALTGFDSDATGFLAGLSEVSNHALDLARFGAEFATIPPISAGLAELFASETLRIGDLGLDLAKIVEAHQWVPSIWDSPLVLPPELAPGSPEGDFFLIQDVRADPELRLAALRRAAARMAWVGYRPGVRKALLRQAGERKISAKQLLRDELVAAMVLVLGSDSEPQTVRLGTQWVTDEQGKVIAFPPEQLDVWSYRDWFTAAVVRTVRRSLLDRPDVLPIGQGRPIEEQEGRVVQLADVVGEDGDLPGPETDDPLTLLVAESDHSEACRRLAAVLDLATPVQTQILRLLASGFKNNEIARELGITPGAVRTQFTLLRKKVRREGLAA